MKEPMPIDQLPNFIARVNPGNQPGSNPWLKFIIVGGVIFLGLAISATVIKKAQQNRLKIKENENRKG